MAKIPKAVVEIDGKDYSFVLDLAAMYSYKQMTGKDLMKGEVPTETEETISFIQACLKRDHPDLTQEDVGHLVHPGNLAEIMDGLLGLYADSSPEPTGDSGN